MDNFLDRVGAIESALSRIEEKLDRALHGIHRIKQEEKQIMTSLDSLTAQVAATRTIAESAKALIEGIPALIEAAGTDPVALAALVADLKASSDELGAAVIANTPAAPPSTEEFPA